MISYWPMLCNVRVIVLLLMFKLQLYISKFEYLHSSAVLFTVGRVWVVYEETQKASIPAIDIVIAIRRTDATKGDIPFIPIFYNLNLANKYISSDNNLIDGKRSGRDS